MGKKDNNFRTYNNQIFHKISDYSFAPADISMAFQIRREISLVVGPQSDMPYVLLRWYPTSASVTGWPARAANPAAYVSLLSGNLNDDDLVGVSVVNHPILLSNVPTVLKPGWYVSALPMMAFCGDQWDYDHGTIGTVIEKPVVFLIESDKPVLSTPYQFTTKLTTTSGGNIVEYWPWLLVPDNGGIGNSNSVLISGICTNRTGTSPTGQTTPYYRIYTKSNTFPDTAVARNHQSQGGANFVNNNTETLTYPTRYSWFKLAIILVTGDPEASIPNGIGIVID